MRVILTALIILTAGTALGHAQTTAAAQPATSLSTSAILQPALDGLAQAVASVKPEKWKGGSVREEATQYIASIQKDLQGALPALITVADATPGSTSKAMAVSRNVDALYDVLLRVVDGARIAGPVDQVNRLQDAMLELEKSRHILDEQLISMASSQEKQLVDLQAALRTPPPAAACPAPPPAPEPAPRKKVVRKKKPAPAPKPAPANSQPAPAPKPN